MEFHFSKGARSYSSCNLLSTFTVCVILCGFWINYTSPSYWSTIRIWSQRVAWIDLLLYQNMLSSDSPSLGFKRSNNNLDWVFYQNHNSLKKNNFYLSFRFCPYLFQIFLTKIINKINLYLRKVIAHMSWKIAYLPLSSSNLKAYKFFLPFLKPLYLWDSPVFWILSRVRLKCDKLMKTLKIRL